MVEDPRAARARRCWNGRGRQGRRAAREHGRARARGAREGVRLWGWRRPAVGSGAAWGSGAAHASAAAGADAAQMAPQRQLSNQEAALCRGYLDLVAPVPARARPAPASPYLEAARRVSLFRNAQMDNDLAFIRRALPAGTKGMGTRCGGKPDATLAGKEKP